MWAGLKQGRSEQVKGTEAVPAFLFEELLLREVSTLVSKFSMASGLNLSCETPRDPSHGEILKI